MTFCALSDETIKKFFLANKSAPGYYGDEPVELDLTPEMEEPKWLFFEVSQDSETRYTHMADCELVFFNKNGYELDTGYQVIENGCVSENIDDFQSGPFNDQTHFVYVSEDERTKSDRADRFGVQIYDVDDVANYQVRCHLHACEYGNDLPVCGLRDSCPADIEGRYDEIFGKSNVRKRRSSEGVNGDPKMVLSPKFDHPCLKFKNTEAEYLCFPEDSDNCWLRTACEDRI
jgi:hypothetical protein